MHLPFIREQTAVISLRVVPDSWQKSFCLGGKKLPPSSSQKLFLFLILTPIAPKQDLVASVSRQTKGEIILLFPFDRPAKINARWVSLFEGGTEIVPANLPF